MPLQAAGHSHYPERVCALPGDLIAVFYEKPEPLENYIRQLRQPGSGPDHSPLRSAYFQNTKSQPGNSYDYHGN